jgi:hypothetical protein
MRDRSEQFVDERTLRSVAVPNLAAGRHQSELCRSLMQEARTRTDRRAAAFRWLRRPAFGVAILVLLVVGLCWVVLVRGRTDTKPSGEGLGAVVRKDGGADQAGRDAKLAAEAIREAIESFDVRLEQVLATRTGGRAYVYRTTRAGGRDVVFSSDRILASNALQNPVKQQEFEMAVASGEGGVVGQRVSDLGTLVYQYRINFYDGTSETYGSDCEPDRLQRERHRLELEQAIAQGRGELAKTIPAADGTATSLIKVTLSDGTIKTYADQGMPKGR